MEFFNPYTMANRIRHILLILIATLVFGSLYAQDFVYEPVNPAFGGSYLNYSWLLSSAESQNTFTDPTQQDKLMDDSDLEDFEENLQRQILNQLARELTRDQFGSDGLEEGYYEVGNFQINVTSDLDGLIIHIVDLNTGGESTISVPYY